MVVPLDDECQQWHQGKHPTKQCKLEAKHALHQILTA